MAFYNFLDPFVSLIIVGYWMFDSVSLLKGLKGNDLLGPKNPGFSHQGPIDGDSCLRRANAS